MNEAHTGANAASKEHVVSDDTAKENGDAVKNTFRDLRTAYRNTAQRIHKAYDAFRRKKPEITSDNDNTEMVRLGQALAKAEAKAAQGLGAESDDISQAASTETVVDHKPETLTITGEQYLHLSEPLFTKTFRKYPGYGDTQSEDLKVYADFALTEPGGTKYRIAVTKKDIPDIPSDEHTSEFQAVPYGESIDGERTEFDKTQALIEGEKTFFPPSLYIKNIGGDVVIVGSHNCEASVPNQDRKQHKLAELAASGNPMAREYARKVLSKDPSIFIPTLRIEPTTWDEKQGKTFIEHAAERFPDDVEFTVKLHRGGHKVEEGYVETLEEHIKGSWMVFTEGLGLDPRDFPIDKIDVWAPVLADKTRGTYRNRMRDAIHRRKRVAREFNGMRGPFHTEGLHVRDKHGNTTAIHMPMRVSGVINFGLTAHELFHGYLKGKDAMAVAVEIGDYGKVLDEGMASMADQIILPQTLTPDKVSITDKPDFEEKYRKFLYACRDESTNHVKDDDKQPLLLREQYNPANAVLHLYLLKERGGIDHIRELAQSDITSRERFMAAYERVYGEPFADLAVKAIDWFRTYHQQNQVETP